VSARIHELLSDPEWDVAMAALKAMRGMSMGQRANGADD
jgi:hypothetical protein